MKGKTILITGATSGIGKATAMELAKQGAKLIFNTRDKARGESVREELIQKSGNPDIHVLPCDFSALRQVTTFADHFLQHFDTLDILINNAGAFYPELTASSDGIEATFAVNHLAPFLLTQRLIDRMKESAPARIINVASAAHKGQTIRFDILKSNLESVRAQGKYSGLSAYGQSKLANILFTRSLARRLEGTEITVNALHPGVIRTRIVRNASWVLQGLFLSIGRSVKKGAQTTLYLATSEEGGQVSGEYFVNKQIDPGSAASRDREVAEALWKFSEETIAKVLS